MKTPDVTIGIVKVNKRLPNMKSYKSILLLRYMYLHTVQLRFVLPPFFYLFFSLYLFFSVQPQIAVLCFLFLSCKYFCILLN